MPTPPAGASADLFQALVEHSSDAVAVLDERGLIQFTSRSAERVLGFPPDDRPNHSAFEHIHETDRARVVERFSLAVAEPGVPVTLEFRIRHKDGSWRDIEAVAVNRLAERTIGGIVVNYRDITERKRAEAALRASEERLRHLFESAPDLIYYCSPDGRFTYVNPTASRVMKYSQGELIGRHFLTLIDSNHRPAATAFYSRQLADRTANTYYEFPAVTKDGLTIWVGQHVQLVVDHDEIVGVQAIARDISKQKDAEDRLRQSEAKYRSLIHGAAYAIFRTTSEGEIVDANPALARMLGYPTVDELRTVNMADVWASRGEREEMIDRHRREGRELSGNVTWRKKDGTPITVHLSGRLVEDDAGRPDGFEAIAEDTTERRALEEQLRQSQKMEAVGRLARGIAHDFNNVLAAILGCSDLLQARLDPDDPAYLEAAEIGKAAERGAALTRQLLAFSRRQVFETQVLDLHAVVRTFDMMLRRLAGDIDLRLHTPGPPPMVRAEHTRIGQVVMNLVVNARDATPVGGAIDVIVDTIDLAGAEAARFPDMPPGRYARLAVHDSGSGIAPEVQYRVFEPFFSTKDPSNGSGLGLSIVYGIAKEAGGTVTFSSLRAQGTTFEVLLPLVEART